MTCRTAATALGLALLLAFAMPASGQPKPKPETQAQVQNEERCRLVPGEDEKTLSDRLGACDGVLEPPPAGDAEIIQPPPDTGETPVIPPERLPDQPDAD